MLNQLHRSLQRHRVELYALTLFVVLTLFMLEPLNMYLAWSLLYGYGLYLFVVLMAFYLYFCGFRDGREIAVAVLFTVWLVLSRVLNGDVVLEMDGWNVLKAPLMVCMLSLGPVLSRAQRRRALYGFGLAAGVYFTVLGVIDLYCFVTRRTLYYALTQVETGISHGFRMQILGYNPNTVGFWYLLSSAFLLYIFLDCRRRGWRIPLALMLLIHYLTLASSYSRNAELGYSLGAGLLAALLLGKRLPAKTGRAGRAALLVLTALLAGLLCFKGFSLGTSLAGKCHELLFPAAQTVETETPAPAEAALVKRAAAPAVLSAARDAQELEEEEDEEDEYRDARSLTDDSQRLLIYKTVPEIFRQEPLRLLRGCLYEERLSISNPLLPKQKTMLHNTWLEILNYTGVPGLLLLLAFTVFMLIDCVKLYFSADPRHTVPIKILTLPVLASFSFSLLESFLWFRTDFMTLSCYLFMGFVIAELREGSAHEA